MVVTLKTNVDPESTAVTSELNAEVRSLWERSPCGTSRKITHELAEGTVEWYEAIESFRYAKEPCIHAVAQFTRYHGKNLLEIGVGAGTDQLQWARAGAICHGVDLTEAAVELTRKRLALYGLKSDLLRHDAESLLYPDSTFNIVYSWGVIHHSEHPERIIADIARVLKLGGEFIGMMYSRRSLKVVTLWVYCGLLRGKPWMSFRRVCRDHVESKGTKAYTCRELRKMFSQFRNFSTQPILTPYDTQVWPRWLARFFPQDWDWFIALRALR